MAVLPGSNQDDVTVADRQASGSQPDNSTPTGTIKSGGGGGGTVDSVGLSMPSAEFAVANSPVTSSGTILVTKGSISANKVAAGPASGSPAAWAFRALQTADMAPVTQINETSTPATLTVGAVPDGSYVKRSGTALVGGTPPGGGNVTGPASSTDGDIALFSGPTGEIIKDGGPMPTSLPPNGVASGDLGGTYPSPTALAMHESSGPTKLTYGAVPDGSFLKRVGVTVVGGTPPGGGNVSGPASSVDGDFALFSGTTGEVIKDGGAPGQAAFKAVSDNTQAKVSSVKGPITTGHQAIFADTTGTVKDGGSIPFNVVSYGADPTGVADSTTAINAALAAAMLLPYSCVYFPAGKYLVSAPLTLTYPIRTNGTNCSLVGDGMLASQIICAHSGNGLYVDCSANPAPPTEPCYRYNNITIRGLAVLAQNPNTPYASATGIVITYGTSEAAQPNAICVDIQDVLVRHPVNSNAVNQYFGWTNGIMLMNCWNTHLRNVWILGNQAPYVWDTTQPAGSGIGLNAVGGVEHDWYGIYQVFWRTTAYKFSVSGPLGSVTQASQGITMVGCNVTDCVQCMNIVVPAGSNFGSLRMSDFEWSCCDFTSPAAGGGPNQQMISVDSSATSTHSVDIMVTNGYFCQANNLTGATKPLMILNAAWRVTFSNCEFFWNGQVSAPLIHLTNVCKNVKFDGCIFDGAGYTAITIDTGCYLNSILGCFLNGATISDSGTSTIIANNQP